MTDGLVHIDPFFKSKFRFPWDFMGMTIPCAGSVGSYIASAMAPLIPEFRELLAGKPAMFELRRFAKLGGDASIFNQIVKFCDGCQDSRDSVATKVLNFLSENQLFRQEFQRRIDEAYLAGRIKIPTDCLPREKWHSRHSSGPY